MMTALPFGWRAARKNVRVGRSASVSPNAPGALPSHREITSGSAFRLGGGAAGCATAAAVITNISSGIENFICRSYYAPYVAAKMLRRSSMKHERKIFLTRRSRGIGTLPVIGLCGGLAVVTAGLWIVEHNQLKELDADRAANAAELSRARLQIQDLSNRLNTMVQRQAQTD